MAGDRFEAVDADHDYPHLSGQPIPLPKVCTKVSGMIYESRPAQPKSSRSSLPICFPPLILSIFPSIGSDRQLWGDGLRSLLKASDTASLRRRKTKCDGARPRCRQCTLRNVTCCWDALEGATELVGGECATVPSSIPWEPTTSVSPSSSILSSSTLPQKSLRRCFDLFYANYLQTIFCSFLHTPAFEETADATPFLTASIVCLTSRHLSPEEAQEGFGLAGGDEVCRQYTRVARGLAKDSVFTPSVANIQGNLVFALSELLNRSGSSHWMLAGTAIRMAQIMRLNKEYHERTSQTEQEIRRRTFWACTMMDRLLAFVLTKPSAISMDHTATYLPNSDAALAYEDVSRGLTLSTLESFTGLSSDVGILPYFVKTMILWGDSCIPYIRNARFVDPLPPTDSDSAFFKSHCAMCKWEAAIPASMRWNAKNYQIQSANGNGTTYVAMHFLLRSSYCVAHQSYLPHLDGTSIILDGADAAGWPLLSREPTLATTCVTNALLVGEMLADLFEEGSQSHRHLQSAWVAASLLSVTSTFMWILYANDGEFSTEENKKAVEKYLGLTQRLLSSWGSGHRLVQAWINTIDDMHSVYRAAYLGQAPVDDGTSVTAMEDSRHEESPDFRPQPGDGFIPLSTAHDIHSSLRVIMGDSTAHRPMARTVWMCFSLGWPLWLGDPTESSMPEPTT